MAGVLTRGRAFAYLALGFGLLLRAAGPASAETYPARPIRIIAPVAAGAATDVLARLTASWLSMQMGQPVVVENRAGAGGNLAVETVARAEPDGYTLLFATNGTIAINRALMKNAAVDPLELVPVAPVATTANLFVINATVPARTLSDFIALAKAQPGKINYASAGLGTTPHLAGALFARLAGVDMVHVPYRGAAPATTDLVAGNVQMLSIGYATVAPFVDAGKLRVLAVAGPKRLSYLPDVPAAAEAGLPGWEMETWYGLFAPPGTPKAVVDRLNRSVQGFLDDNSTKLRFEAGFYGMMKMTPEEFAARVHEDAERSAQIVRDAGIAQQ
jgi:tripartite-type tricarboxylate transporter receptor subunit TctC